MTAPPTPTRIVLTTLAGMGAALLAIALAHGGGGVLLWLCALAACAALAGEPALEHAADRAPTLLARGAGIGIPFLFASRCSSCGR